MSTTHRKCPLGRYAGYEMASPCKETCAWFMGHYPTTCEETAKCAIPMIAEMLGDVAGEIRDIRKEGIASS